MEIPLVCLIYTDLISHQKKLSHFLFLHKIPTIPVDIPQAYHLISYLETQWWSISQLHRIHQFTLPVEINFHSHQSKNKSDSLKFSPQHNSPPLSHYNSLWILILLPVLYLVPFQVMGTQIYSLLLSHM